MIILGWFRPDRKLSDAVCRFLKDHWLTFFLLAGISRPIHSEYEYSFHGGYWAPTRNFTLETRVLIEELELNGCRVAETLSTGLILPSAKSSYELISTRGSDSSTMLSRNGNIKPNLKCSAALIFKPLYELIRFGLPRFCGNILQDDLYNPAPSHTLAYLPAIRPPGCPRFYHQGCGLWETWGHNKYLQVA